MKRRKIIRAGLIILLAAVIGFSGYQLFVIRGNYADEAKIHEALLRYEPALPAGPNARASGAESSGGDAEASTLNPSVTALQAKYAGVVGWLTVPNTKIDYPFAQADDNDYYLHADLSGNALQAGTIFMDYRNHADFSDFNTILYGHHMKNGSMFGTLQNFNSQSFFNTNTTGTIFLADKTYTITFFAYIVLQPDDPYVYNPSITTDADKTAYFAHVKSIARYYRDPGNTTDEHILTLSSCDYEFDNAREVLLGRLTEN